MKIKLYKLSKLQTDFNKSKNIMQMLIQVRIFNGPR